ncbi:MAG TPA: hypothetical protein VD907_06545 [Verrucomicrobiae bacterium]|nr:hypothetical protein [Verrucomicrobiae bacterium]
MSVTSHDPDTARFFFAAVSDVAYGGSVLYRSDQSRVETTYRGPFHAFPNAAEAPEVGFSDLQFGAFYWECASLPPGRYWHINQSVSDGTLDLVEISRSGQGRIRMVAWIYSETHLSDVLRKLGSDNVPLWVQERFLGSMITQGFAELVELSGRAPIDSLYSGCFTQLSQEGTWLYSDGKRTIFVDLIEGGISDNIALPRRTKKALRTPPAHRTQRQHRLIARIKPGPLQHWSGGFRVNDSLELVPFDDDLQATLNQMSALFDGQKLIDPDNFFGGIKYVILSQLLVRGRLSYAAAYEQAAELIGCDHRLRMPVGSYRYDLVFHEAWEDIAFEVRRAAATQVV